VKVPNLWQINTTSDIGNAQIGARLTVPFNLDPELITAVWNDHEEHLGAGFVNLGKLDDGRAQLLPRTKIRKAPNHDQRKPRTPSMSPPLLPRLRAGGASIVMP
jgi:hypothetical protein